MRTSRWGRGSARLRLAGSLTFSGTAAVTGPESAVLSLVAVDEITGFRAALPFSPRHVGFSFDFATALDLRRICADLPAGRHATLRLCLGWENSYWETTVSSDRPLRALLAGSRTPAGVLVLGPLPRRP